MTTARRNSSRRGSSRLIGLVLAGLGVGANGCEDSSVAVRAAADASPYVSFRPGASSSGAVKSADAASGASLPTGNGAEVVQVQAGDVARLVGSMLYVLNPWRGLQIIDVSNAAAPKLVARAEMTGQPVEMYIGDGEALVILSHVARLASESGQPQPRAGSQVRRVRLGSQPQTLATLDLEGTVHASRRIGDKLVLLVPQISWNPWYWRCWGPYGCVADAVANAQTGTANGSAAAAGAGAGRGATAGQLGLGGRTATGNSWAWPWGYNQGVQADQTAVTVVDFAQAGSLRKVGEVIIAGGVSGWTASADEVLIANQQWSWVGGEGTLTERLVQVRLGNDGLPSVGAQRSVTRPWTQDGATFLRDAFGLSRGRMLLVRQSWQSGGGHDLQLEQAEVDGTSWQTRSTWQREGTAWGTQVAVDGTTALVAGHVADNGTATGKAELAVDVISLAEAATLTVTGRLVAPDGLDSWTLQLHHLSDQRWVLGGLGSSYDEARLRTLDSGGLGAPQWLGELTVRSSLGVALEVLSPQLLALAVQDAEPRPRKDGAVAPQTGVQLISLDDGGRMALRGVFASQYVYWQQLRSLFSGARWLRLAHAALETIDIADLDQPRLLATLELATEVVDVASANGRAVAAVRSWRDGKTSLRVMASGSADELRPDGQLDLDLGFGRLYAYGKYVYAVDYDRVQVVDVSDPSEPRARGSWRVQPGTTDKLSYFWWNPWDVPQRGTTLYLIGTEVSYSQRRGEACSGGEPATDAAAVDGGAGEDGGMASDGEASDAAVGDTTPSDGGPADVADAGTPMDMEADTAEKDGGGVVCWSDPSYTTRVVALDLSNPDAPQLGGSVELPGVSWVSHPTVQGDLLVLDHFTSLQGADGQWFGQYWLDRIDVSQANAPKWLDHINIPGWLVGMADDGGSAVTLDWQVQAGTTPEDGRIVNRLCNVTLAGGRAERRQCLDLPEQAGATLRYGNAIYVATWPYWWAWPLAAGSQPNAQLLAFDASDPLRLVQTAALDPGSGIGWLQVAGGRLFGSVGGMLGMSVWRLQPPTLPAFEAFLPTQGWWTPRVEVIGGAAYVPAGWYGLQRWTLAP